MSDWLPKGIALIFWGTACLGAWAKRHLKTVILVSIVWTVAAVIIGILGPQSIRWWLGLSVVLLWMLAFLGWISLLMEKDLEEEYARRRD